MASSIKKRGWLTISEIAEKEYKDFRLLILLAICVLGPVFGIAPALPIIFTDLSRFVIVLFWLYPFVFLAELIAGMLLLRDGWSLWFTTFISAAMIGMGVFGASLFFIASRIEGQGELWLSLTSWFILSVVMWWWGSRVYCSSGEIKETVLRSKRIDLEQATYSPYHYPSDLFKAGWARSTVSLSVLVGGTVIGISVFVNHLLSSRNPEGESFWAAICGYILVLISVASISAPYHEWRWMRRWEKKTGRKIYVKEIIEYKRLKQKKKQMGSSLAFDKKF